MNCDQAKEVGPAIMYKLVGQEIKSSHSNALLESYSHGQGQGQAARWKTAGPRSRGSVQQANFISTSSNIRRWRQAANIIDKDHGILALSVPRQPI